MATATLSPDNLEDVFTDAEITLTFLLDDVTIHRKSFHPFYKINFF